MKPFQISRTFKNELVIVLTSLIESLKSTNYKLKFKLKVTELTFIFEILKLDKLIYPAKKLLLKQKQILKIEQIFRRRVLKLTLLSMNFLSSGGCALLMVSNLWRLPRPNPKNFLR